MKTQNMLGRTGKAVANQFIITGNEKCEEIYNEGLYNYIEIFQSYDSIIVKIIDGKTYLDRSKWDYSKKTGKYRNQFLGETKKETEKKIASGEYILTDLN